MNKKNASRCHPPRIHVKNIRLCPSTKHTHRDARTKIMRLLNLSSLVCGFTNQKVSTDALPGNEWLVRKNWLAQTLILGDWPIAKELINYPCYVFPNLQEDVNGSSWLSCMDHKMNMYASFRCDVQKWMDHKMNIMYNWRALLKNVCTFFDR